MKKFKRIMALTLTLAMLMSAGCSVSDILSGSGGRSRSRHEHDDDEDEEEFIPSRVAMTGTQETDGTDGTEDTFRGTVPQDTEPGDTEPDEPGEEPGAPLWYDEGELCEQAFGSYYISNGWVNVPSQSMPPDTYTYCMAGNENSQTPPNNIVVRHGENFYAADDHETFCTAILVQVQNQAADYGGTAYMAEYGPVNGTMVYKFVLDCEPYTEQWYFCGDYEFVMVGMSIFDEDEAENDHIRDVAQTVVDSFEWP